MAELRKEIKYLPVFIILTCVYFWEVFLKGAVLAVGDGFNQFYPLMVTASNQYKNFIFPFWNPYMYSGFPLFGSMQTGILYPFHVVLPLLLRPDLAFNLDMILHYSLAGFFTFLYCRQIGLGIVPSLFSGTVFSLLGYLPAHLMHPSIVSSAVWMPLLFYFSERLKQSLNVKYALCASVVIALQVFAGHPQICFYTYVLLLLYVILQLFYIERSDRVKFALLSLSSLSLGIVLALPQILATQQLASLAARAEVTYDFFSSYAFPLHMMTSFIFPFFYYYGGSSGKYWGPEPDLGVDAFVGTLPFLLALLVMMRWKKDPHILFWGIVSVLALLLALGDAVRPLNKLVFHLPGFNSFRGPSKHLLEMSLALSVLTGFGVSFLQDREGSRRFHAALVLSLSAVVVVSLITFTFFDSAVRDFFKTGFSQMHHLQLRWDRGGIPEKALNITDQAIYIPVLTIAAYLACLVLFLKAGKKRLRNACLVGIFLILFGEALVCKEGVADGVAFRSYNRDLFTALASFQDSGPDSGKSGRTIFFTPRVSILSAMPYGIRLSEGYDPLEIGDYREVLPSVSQQSPQICRAFINNNSLISMMNVRYLVVDNALGSAADVRWYMAKDPEGRQYAMPPVTKRPPGAELFPVYRMLALFPRFTLYENMIALPRAHSVSRLRPLNSIIDLSPMLFSYWLDPWHEAVISKEDLHEIGVEDFSPGDVTILEETADRLAVSARFPGTGFVVLADQFYPGWEAYIDGKPTKIYKTNGVQRGVVIPQGEHRVVFKYVPRRIYASMVVSGILFAGILFLLLRRNIPKS